MFSFGWTLYVHIKGDNVFSCLLTLTIYTAGSVCVYTGKYPAIADDLVNSHHLLLCCVDTLYTAVVSLGNRHDLLNDSFIGTHIHCIEENI